MIAAWAGVYQKEIKAGRQDAETWLQKEFKTNQEMFFDYCLEVDDFEYILDRKTSDYLRRFRLFKDYNVHSYSNIYDELPAVWIDVMDILTLNYKLAMDCKNGS